MYQFIIREVSEPIETIALNRPEVLNAWHRPMREELVDALTAANADSKVRAVILTGTGRAFCAGQDLNEARTFDAVRAEEWIEEWRVLYDTVRRLEKPLVIALNGVAAGSAFQTALLADVRVGHPGVRMGQPEINSGIPSITGFWIMREVLGLSRAIELVLTGRMLDGQECHALGLIHYLVPENQVISKAQELANLLAGKPPIAMRLDKQRFREVTQRGFDETIAAAARIHHEAYALGEPQQMIERFLATRTARRPS